jgi:hypothetical protein
MLPQARRGAQPRAPFRTSHQLPPGCEGWLHPTGYGHLICHLKTPAGTFTGGGHSDWQALRTATAAARAAGAIQ